MALEGNVADHHRFMRKGRMDHLEYLEHQIEQFSRRIEEVSRPFVPAIEAVASLPGFDQRSAQNVVVELSADMAPFLRTTTCRLGSPYAPAATRAAASAKVAKPPKATAAAHRLGAGRLCRDPRKRLPFSTPI